MEKQAAAITVDDLQKSFGKVEVLKGVSFEVERGAIYALLGSNGAGKTTTINILTSLLGADSGKATVGGFDVAREASKVRRTISLTGQFAAVDEILTGRENLELIGDLRHVKDSKGTATSLLAQFDLTEAGDRRVSTYSGGMRRRLDIAMSLIGDPTIIFLDEPTTGLDPQSRNGMWETIQSLAKSGKTIFLTTQYLEEADLLADRIAILNEGKIVAEGTPAALKKLLPQGQIELKFLSAESLADVSALLKDYEVVEDAVALSLSVATSGGVAEITRLLTKLENAKVEVAEFAQKSPTLDDVFLQIVNTKKEKKS